MKANLARTGALAAALLLSACSVQQPAAPATPLAKNVILFIGDGMGVTTVTAARIYGGQLQGLPGEEHQLAFERFPNVALVKTYSVDRQVPKSAPTATAMVTGEKTRGGLINISAEGRRKECALSMDKHLTSISETAKSRGASVGVVTTARLTHATPAVVFAHTPERYWETDGWMPDAAREQGCRDIAWQLVNAAPGGGLDVAMGGARKFFFGADRGGERLDPAADLVSDWLARAPDRRYAETAEQMAAARPGEQLLGLFSDSHLTYVAELPDESNEPSLAAMTAKAIELLAANDNGYFLMVEGGRIDHGHHDGRPGYALVETLELDEAVDTALSMVDLDETLILVTADHSHVMSMGGYSVRGNPILGYVVQLDDRGVPRETPSIALDGQPYTTLAYANGPGARVDGARPRPDTGVDAIAQALVPNADYNPDGSINNRDETHGGEDVALYGIGPGSDMVRGVIEQNLIYDIMIDALGWR